jgi:hypothetical protein
MAQMCFGLRGGFGPIIRAWFHGTQVERMTHSLLGVLRIALVASCCYSPA